MQEINQFAATGSGVMLTSVPLMTPTSQSNHSLLFIDSKVADIPTLLQSVATGTDIYMLRSGEDAISQITQTLLGRSGITSLQIVSHGRAGGLQLGTSWLDAQTLPKYVHQIQTWSQALSADADILLYGCDVGQDTNFIEQLAQMTGSDVAASNDLTGSAALGGDWDLEVRSGQIESTLLAPQHYQNLLAWVVQEINPNPSASRISGLTGVNDTLYFGADDGIHGRELWKSDGTAAGTMMLKNIAAIGNSSPTNLTNVNGTLYFTADDGIHGRELWKSDGTAAGTVMVSDIAAGSNGAFFIDLLNVNGTLYFTVDDGIHGSELWKSDGTAAGTVRLSNLISSQIDPFSQLGSANGAVYFSARDLPNSVTQLWRSDGSAEGTLAIKNMTNNSPLAHLTDANGTLYFTAGDSFRELWKSDGTEAGTVMVQDFWLRTPSSNGPIFLTNLNGTLHFVAGSASEYETLWRSDGTTTGTTNVLSNTNGNNYGTYLSSLLNANGTLYFGSSDSSVGVNLWKSDGTAAGTTKVKNLSTNYAPRPFDLTNVNGSVYFKTRFSPAPFVTTYELWKSDGTENGTLKVAAFSSQEDRTQNLPGEQRFAPPAIGALASVNGSLYFTTNENEKLWIDRPNGWPAPAIQRSELAHGSTAREQSISSLASNLLSNYPAGFSYVVTTDRPELFTVLPSLDPNGTLTYKLKAGLKLNQSISLTIQLKQPDGAINPADTLSATLNLTYQPEVLVRDQSTGELSLVSNDPVTQQQSRRAVVNLSGQPSTIGADWQVAEAEDFNRDGIADMLLYNRQGDEVQLWTMNQNGQVTTAAPLIGQDGQILRTRNQNWQVVGMADINGDTILDIIWHNQNDDEIAFWFMQANGIVGSYDYLRDSNGTIVKTRNSNWQMIDFADFDGDGDIDLAFRLAELNQTAIVRLQGQTLIDSQYLTPNANPNLVMRGAADSDGDRSVDLYWQTPNNSQVILQRLQFQDGRWVSEFSLIANDLTGPLIGVADLDRNNTPDLLQPHQIGNLVNNSVIEEIADFGNVI